MAKSDSSGSKAGSSKDSPNVGSLEQAVRNQMPGWKLAAGESDRDAMSAGTTGPRAEPGVDLQTLRRKFLGAAAAEVAPASDAAAGGTSEPVEVFRIEPKEGGPSRVAERRNGKITIVSG